MDLIEAGSSSCKDNAAGKNHDSLPLILSNSGTSYPGIEVGSSSLRTHPLQFSTNAQYTLTHRSEELQLNSSVDVRQQHSLHPLFSSACTHLGCAEKVNLLLHFQQLCARRYARVGFSERAAKAHIYRPPPYLPVPHVPWNTVSTSSCDHSGVRKEQRATTSEEHCTSPRSRRRGFRPAPCASKAGRTPRLWMLCVFLRAPKTRSSCF